MKDWETEEFKHLLELFVGDAYGDNPIDRLDHIRSDKRANAQELCDILNINSSSRVLEIGSGFGYESRLVAENAASLDCFDISESFLKQAKRECEGLSNITFHHLKTQPPQFPLADESVDIVFSSAVFIHLNLFDIYWHFSEFNRLLKPGGKVFFDVLNAAEIQMDKFAQTADYYKDNIESIRNLVSWNAIPAIESIAAHWSFKMVSDSKDDARNNRHDDENTDLLFVKK